LPFCHLALKAKRPVAILSRNPLKTLGDHLRKKRFDLGLLQREVAERLGVSAETIVNWEGNATTPICHRREAIVHFLGYNPFPKPRTLGEQLVWHRWALGLSQRRFAKRLKIDQGTLGRWERGERQPTGKYLARVKCALEGGKVEF